MANINSVIIGVGGRMGKNNYKLLEKQSDIKVVGGVEAPKGKLVGQPLKDISGNSSTFKVQTELTEIANPFEVVVDFSGVKSTLHHLAVAKKMASTGKKIGWVIGTTGFDEEQLNTIKAYGNDFPILLSGNFSTGINLLLKLIELGARALGSGYDIEVVEHHHREKVDAPSGTAMMIANSLMQEKGLTSEALVNGRKGIIGRREEATIGMSVLRGGGVIGQHEVHFLGDNEKLLVSHEAFNRDAFTNGVVKGVYFIAEKVKQGKNGFFNMQDVLGLNV